DDELGRHTRFRQALRERGERYVLGVPCTTSIRDLEAPLPAYHGRGRRPKAPWYSVSAWRHALAPDRWTRVTVRDGAARMAGGHAASPHGRGCVGGASFAGCPRSGCPLWLSLLS